MTAATATMKVRSRWRGLWAFRVASYLGYMPMTPRAYERLLRWLMRFVALETSANGGPWERANMWVEVSVEDA